MDLYQDQGVRGHRVGARHRVAAGSANSVENFA
jgi:hypothetical protein